MESASTMCETPAQKIEIDSAGLKQQSEVEAVETRSVGEQLTIIAPVVEPDNKNQDDAMETSSAEEKLTQMLDAPLADSGEKQQNETDYINNTDTHKESEPLAVSSEAGNVETECIIDNQAMKKTASDPEDLEMQVDITCVDIEDNKSMLLKETEADLDDSDNHSPKKTNSQSAPPESKSSLENDGRKQKSNLINETPTPEVNRKRRKVPKKTWSMDAVTPPAPKKAKGGLRADCPTFCRAGCTNTHHDLLISARRMVENDSVSTHKFLDHVAKYYEGPTASMKTAELIFDPWKETNYPLLHYLALMGKCAGCFALVDAGHDPKTVVAENKDTVLHTMIRVMYVFNCTHGHMDILLKKFNLLLKEFKDCLYLTNDEDETPFHVCAKMIANYSKLLQTEGKPPFRLYQYLKNMFLSSLEYVTEEDLPKLSWLNKDGSTASHYVAEDRGSNEILDVLREKGVDFSIRDKANETVDEIHKKAPPPPSEDVLQLARLSEKGNKYKSKSNKASPKTIPKPAQKNNVKESLKVKFRSSPKIKITKPRKSMEPLKEPLKLVETNVTKQFTPIAPKPLPAAVSSKSKEAFSPSMVAKEITVMKREPNPTDTKIEIMKTSPSFVTNKSSSQTTKANSNFKPRVKFVEVKTPSVAVTQKNDSNNIATEAKIVSPFAKTDNLTWHLMTDKLQKAASSLVSQQVEPAGNSSPSMVSVSSSMRTQPLTITKPAPGSHNSPFPKIANVQSLKISATGIRPPTLLANPIVSKCNTQVTSPTTSIPSQRHIPPSANINMNGHSLHAMATNLAQQPPMSFVPNRNMSRAMFSPAARFVQNQRLQNMGSTNQFNNVMNMQRPIIVKTPDGKLMSLNVYSGNSKENVPRTLAPKIYSVPGNPMSPGSFRPGPMYQPVLPPSVQNNFRYVTPPNNMNPQMICIPASMNGMPIPSSINGLPSANGTSPVVLPHSFMNAPQMLQTGVSSMTPVNIGPVNTYSMAINPKLVNSKLENGKKSKSLEASIKNLHNSVGAATHSKTRTTNKRLCSSFSPPDENAPPVIILDGDDLSETEASPNTVTAVKEKCSPGDTSISPNGREQASVDDFLKLSKEKKNALLGQLEHNRRTIIDINDEILKRENEIKATRETIVEREMEIASYRLKLTNMQSNVTVLRAKRSDIVNSATKLEKRIKAVNDRTLMFETLTIEGTNI